MERWVYDSDSGRPGRRRGLFVWLLDAAFAVVTALVALLLLFMYLAPYVSPDASWVFSVLGLVAPVIYVSGLVLFLYWVIRWRWGYASPMLVLLLLGVPKISLYYKIDTLRHYGEPVYDRSALKVMAYNVRMFYGDDGRSTVDSLAAFVNRYDPDILCIEEFSDLARGATMRFDSLIAPGYRRAVYSRDGEGTAGVALAVYSKLRILASGAVDCVNDVDTTRATAVWADLRLDRDTVRVFCNHLRSTHIKSSGQRLPDELPFSDRYGQPRETAQHPEPSALQQHLAFASGRLAVAADRGHTPRTYRVRRFQRYAPVLHLPPHVARIAGCFPREGTGILAYLSGILQYVPHRLRAGFRRFRGAFVRGAVRRVFGSPPRFRPAQIQFATTMILDSLENRARYYALNPRLEKAFDYLLSTDLGALPRAGTRSTATMSSST